MPARFILLMLLTLPWLTTSVAAEQFARVVTIGGTFANMPVDARGEAMGLATTVNPTGPTAFWWNPAPLPESDRVMVSYTDWPHIMDSLKWRPMAIRASSGNLTYGYLWGRLSSDPILIRTGYEPDGNGTYTEASSNLHQFSFAADLIPWLADESSAWQWTVGTNARLYYESLAEQSTSAWDLDLGTSLAWRLTDGEDGDIRLHGSAMVRNLTRGTFDTENTSSALPRYYHFGLSLEVGAGPIWHGSRALAVTVSHAWRRDYDDIHYNYDSEHLGVEMVVGGIASLRTGHRSRGFYADDGSSWGAGLQYRFDWGWGIRAAVDYARQDLDSVFGEYGMDYWTFTAGFDLP